MYTKNQLKIPALLKGPFFCTLPWVNRDLSSESIEICQLNRDLSCELIERPDSPVNPHPTQVFFCQLHNWGAREVLFTKTLNPGSALNYLPKTHSHKTHSHKTISKIWLINLWGVLILDQHWINWIKPFPEFIRIKPFPKDRFTKD